MMTIDRRYYYRKSGPSDRRYALLPAHPTPKRRFDWVLPTAPDNNRRDTATKDSAAEWPTLGVDIELPCEDLESRELLSGITAWKLRQILRPS